MCDASTPVKGSESQTLKSTSESLDTTIMPKIIEGQALTFPPIACESPKPDSESMLYHSTDSALQESAILSTSSSFKNDNTSEKVSMDHEELEKVPLDETDKKMEKALDAAGVFMKQSEDVKDLSINMEVAKATKKSYMLSGPVDEEVTTTKLSMRFHMKDHQFSSNDIKSLVDSGFKKINNEMNAALKSTSTAQIEECSDSLELKAEYASSKKLDGSGNGVESIMDSTSFGQSKKEEKVAPVSPSQEKKRLALEHLMTFSTPARRILGDKTAKIKGRPPVGRNRGMPQDSENLDSPKKRKL